VGILRLPRIANFTDFQPLSRISEVELHYLASPRDLSSYDLLFIPGTKNTRADLGWLREVGWEPLLRRFVSRGGRLVGICGGYQMLGDVVSDPLGVEGPPGETSGLGFLAVATEMAGDKTLRREKGSLFGEEVEGYEIHMGVTTLHGDGPLLQCGDRWDGAIRDDGRVWGCYLHGLLDRPRALAAVLGWASPGRNWDHVRSLPEPAVARDLAYNRLAAHVSAHVDVDRILFAAEG
jgi:adenosylcobyric acid synthase